MYYTESESERFDLDSAVRQNLEGRVNFEKLTQLECNLSYSNKEIEGTISPFWLHISTLKEVYQYNSEYVENIRELGKTFAGWKRVRGDGNCYYRSVITTFFLKIFHFNQHPNRIFKFLQKNSEFKRLAEDHQKNDINYIWQVTNDLYLEINPHHFQSKVNTFEKVLKLIQDPDFDIKLISFARIITYLTLIGEDGAEIRNFLVDHELDSTKSHILELGNEAEGVELSLLPMALDIEVRQTNLLSGKILTSIFPEKGKNDLKLQIDIISKSRGHYDALYSIQDMEDDDYNMKQAKYMIPISN